MDRRSYCNQWSKDIIATIPQSIRGRLQPAVALISTGLAILPEIYTPPVATLVPRPGLMLVGYLASSTYLLEHAVWSWSNGIDDRETDVEVFSRWVMERGLASAIQDVKRSRQDGPQRVRDDVRIAKL